MGHHLSAYIARSQVLLGLADLMPGARILELSQGFWLAPLPYDLTENAAKIAIAADLTRADWLGGGDLIEPTGAALSQRGEVVWMESNWHAGMGENTSQFWRHGAVVIDRTSDDGMLNRALREIGVQRVLVAPPLPPWRGSVAPALPTERPPKLLDEWDSLGLVWYRNDETCFEHAFPIADWRG
ncbi:hypothetical protein [Chondromyces apiculatus]|uniref:Uncharacterized protein n=1 Tax=Chondromyces apiculatus DSM 436 TaxID=1192034 RepID=A0A017TGA8_9BACT|nr:hypothetical protein [Chondromyces apiculatus]EYF08333.1 Hypothetical protein CAP_6094 [Chondromyces apiculatus DSM 436]